MNKTLKRELEVAFSKHAQPVWFRVVKYIVLISLIYFFWGTKWLWILLAIAFVFAMVLHFWYRYKTRDGHRVMAYGSMIKENKRIFTIYFKPSLHTGISQQKHYPFLPTTE